MHRLKGCDDFELIDQVSLPVAQWSSTISTFPAPLLVQEKQTRHWLVDPDRILSVAVAGQGLKMIARGRSQIVQDRRRIDGFQLASRGLEQIGRKTFWAFPGEDGLGDLVLERPDHGPPARIAKAAIEETETRQVRRVSRQITAFLGGGILSQRSAMEASAAFMFA